MDFQEPHISLEPRRVQELMSKEKNQFIEHLTNDYLGPTNFTRYENYDFREENERKAKDAFGKVW